MKIRKDLNKVLLFDGVCNLCSAAVQYVIRHDKQKAISFASLQSSFGIQVLSENHFETTSLKTVIYLKNGEVFIKSAAFLTLMKDLGGWHKLLLIFWIIPAFLRDTVYDLIAKNRYAVFGKKEECYMPTPELMERFIQD